MEQIDLTAPVSTFRVVRLSLEWDIQKIRIVLKSAATGDYIKFSYSGDTALTLMNQLNTMNLTTTSLHKRIINRLIADGLLAGTVSGTPD